MYNYDTWAFFLQLFWSVLVRFGKNHRPMKMLEYTMTFGGDYDGSESMILSPRAESITLSAGCAESIILSAGGAESMMLSA